MQHAQQLLLSSFGALQLAPLMELFALPFLLESQFLEF